MEAQKKVKNTRRRIKPIVYRNRTIRRTTSPSMAITEYLNSKGFTTFEGYSQLNIAQVNDLKDIVKSRSIQHVLEIGFNAGHSAEIFLSTNPGIHLTSFDLGEHSYVPVAKEYIDAKFPGRHTLILGDSRKTVPEYVAANRGKFFDVIFIDGGHDYDVARSDMEYCSKLAHRNTIVILDDTMYTKEWEKYYMVGPTAVWIEYLRDRRIIEINRRDYYEGHGMSWGKYLLSSTV